jgi:hypothetical protein
MIFLSRPSVYNLPGTWEKQPDAIIPHLILLPDQGFILFFGLIVLGLVIMEFILHLEQVKRIKRSY